jgi:opacity protein-like surface antigen
MLKKRSNSRMMVFGIGISCLSAISLADVEPSSESGVKNFFVKNPIVVSVSGGAAWQNASQTQNIALTPLDTRTYTGNSSSSPEGIGELFLGLQSPIGSKLKLQYGLAAVYAGATTISGTVFDPFVGQNTNSYNYQVQHSHLAVKGKLLLGDLVSDWNFSLSPWVSASVGYGMNRASGFTNSVLSSDGATLANFQDNTTNSFVYTLGAGLQYPINLHWQVGIGYEFSDWGKSQLNATPLLIGAPGQMTGAGPSTSHLYTNAVLMNVTYI